MRRRGLGIYGESDCEEHILHDVHSSSATHTGSSRSFLYLMDLKTGYQTPEWASDLYQVPAWAIHTLARKMASIRMMTHGAILEAALKRYGKPKR